MKKNLFIFLAFFIFTTNAFSKAIEELYSQQDFKKLITYANLPTLSKVDCYYIGYAYFQLEDDTNAIKMYDLAIKKGLDDDYIYLYKGLSLRYDKQYDKAIENFRLAINRNPNGQKNYTELGNVYYFTNQYDSALVYFYKAREQKFELGDPYEKIPIIFHTQGKYAKALEEYRISASLIEINDPIYVELLKNIGLLEYTFTKNYPNSIKAYTEMISIVPQQYKLYSKLIKAFYANEDYAKGDSVLNILKVKYEKSELPKEMMEIRGVTVDEFLWNGQKVSVIKYFEKPKEYAETIYQFFLLDKSGTKVIKKVLTEKTAYEIEGTKHLLCGIDKETGTHHTFPIGWKSDDIDYKKLKEYTILIFNGELKPQASSNFETTNKEKKKNKK